MKNSKNILLINLPLRTEPLIRSGFQVSNYSTLNEALDALVSRSGLFLSQPDFLVINNQKIDSSEFGEFMNLLKKNKLLIPSIVLDNNPTLIRMQVYKNLGAGDYLPEDSTTESIVRQLNRVEAIQDSTSYSKTAQPSIKFTKRLFDIVISFFLLLCLTPLFILVMVAIRLESKGSIFYWQPRVGTGYKVFKFFKFRSMRINSDQLLDSISTQNHYNKLNLVTPKDATENTADAADTADLLINDDQLIQEESFIQKQVATSSESFKKFQNDPRITKVGHWIRKTSIDELPQLINVLIGDMSLVGNRPLPLYEAETLTSDEWSERFMAPAGITGLWQVTERGKSATSANSRKQLDNEYARNHNFMMDLKILFKTPLAAIQQENV